MSHHIEIYCDYNATTPLDPRVLEKMLPYFRDLYGNPANGFHRQGRTAAKAVEEAREKTSSLIGAHPGELYFTSGATESNNLAILGLARWKHGSQRNKLVTSAIEHKAVLLPCMKLSEEGFEVVVLPVDHSGRVDLDAAKEAINDRTLFVSVQAANNEIGTLQPVREIASIAHEYGAIMHCDAAQAIGKIPVDVNSLEIDLLSFSAHKFYGPKGIGGLFVRGGASQLPLQPLSFGGGQENNLRPGTSNVPGIVGLGAASEIAKDVLLEESQNISMLHERLESELESHTRGLIINGKDTPRLPNTSSLLFPGVEADVMLLNLPDVMMGTGSACTSGSVSPSHVLQAIGLSRENAFSTVRISIGRFTNREEIEYISTRIVKVYQQLNNQSDNC